MMIVFLGLNMRKFSYAEVPFPGENADEYSFGWLGISLVKDKYPIAWSGVPPYVHDYQKINVDRVFDKDPNRVPFPIDKPWFDHPPLFGLLVGGYAYFEGVRDFASASVLILRRPMIILAIINILLVFILGTLVHKRKLGLLASAIYAFSPLIAISQRLALAENGYIPLFLISLIFSVLYFKLKQIKFWYLACSVSGVSILFKLSALAIPISLLLLVFLEKKKFDLTLIKPVIIAIIAPLVIFVLYGALFDLNMFIRVFEMNSGRLLGAGAEIFYQAVASSKIMSQRTFTDGWILAGWLSIFVLVIRGVYKNLLVKVIFSAVAAYFFIFMIFGGESYGWYRYPFYPLLSLSLAWMLITIYKKANLLVGYMLFLLPFGTSMHRLLGIEGFRQYASIFRLVTIVIFGFTILTLLNWKKAAFVNRILLIFLLLMAFFLSYKEVFFYNEANWIFST